MSRSYRKLTNHLGKSYISGVYAGNKFVELRHPKNYRQALREASSDDGPRFRKGSIPPSTNEDQWAVGRVDRTKLR